MANTNSPYGFSLFGTLGSQDQTGGVSKRTIAYNDTTPIYVGDPVIQNADGTISRGASTGSTATIAGIFQGCKYLSQSLGYVVNSPVWPGSDAASTTTIEAYVIDNPNCTFQVRVGGSTSTGVTEADIGNNINFAIGTPNTSARTSGAYVDITTLAPSTTTRPFRVIGLVTTPTGADGTQAGAYNTAIVAFNNQVFKTLTGI